MGSVKHVLVVWLMYSCILTHVMVKGCICQFGKQFKRINENQTDGICKKIPNSDIVVCERHLLIYLVCESPRPEEIKKAMEATLEQDLEYTSIVEILMTHSNITEITLEIFNFNRLAGTKILNLSDNRISKLPEDLFNSSIFWTLEELNLSFNKIQYLSSNQFVHLWELRNLDLSYNEISQLESEVFTSIPTQDLQYLDIGVNKLTALPDGLFDGIALKSLRTLSLRSNFLSEIPNCVFNSSFFSNLRNLSLFDNFIKQISINSSLVYSKLENLEKLDIGNNEIRNIPFNMFNPLLSSFNWIFLKVLSLEGNYVSYLPPNLFHDTFLLSLEGISFRNNLLETLPSGVLHDSKLTEIKFVNFANNQISMLPSDLFNASNLQNLRQININNNKISYLPYNLLDNPVLQNLVHLDFSDNEISYIPPRFFTNLQNLKVIKLNNNYIQQISADIFSSRLEQLQILDLSHNMITALGGVISNVLSSTERDPLLNVSFNKLSEMETIFLKEQPYNFDHFNLDISFNDISKVREYDSITSAYKPSFTLCMDVKILLGRFVVNVTGNGIFSVNSLVKGMQLDLKNIDWSSPLQIEPCQVIGLHTSITTFPFQYNCNCDMVSYLNLQNSKSFKESEEIFRRFFKLLSSKYLKQVGAVLSDNDFRSLHCGYPSHLSGKYLYEIQPDQLQCQNSDCANVSKCSCTHTPSNSTLRTNCVGLNITNIPDIQLQENSSYIEIYMGFNKIDRFSIQNISNKVIILDLSYNLIRNIPMEFFSHYSNIQKLNLAGNLLLSLPVIAEWDVLNSLSTVEFRENHFLCNCSGLTLKNTLVSLNKKVVIADIEQIQCYTPGNLRHSVIYDLSDSKFGCPFLNNILIISLSLSLLMVIIIIVSISYAYRDYLRLLLF